jgi:hypothetical protein
MKRKMMKGKSLTFLQKSKGERVNTDKFRLKSGQKQTEKINDVGLSAGGRNSMIWGT